MRAAAATRRRPFNQGSCLPVSELLLLLTSSRRRQPLPLTRAHVAVATA